MSNLKNLEALFHHQLRDIYSAEKQLLDALPVMKEKATHNKLKQCFANHLEETKEHKNRLDQIAQSLGIDLSGESCKAMKGLIKEAKEFISEDADSQTRDAGIIADAQRIEHYEIAAYGTAVQFAKGVDQHDIADTLQQTLDEESSTDEQLSMIAVANINKQAKDR